MKSLESFPKDNLFTRYEEKLFPFSGGVGVVDYQYQLIIRPQKDFVLSQIKERFWDDKGDPSVEL